MRTRSIAATLAAISLVSAPRPASALFGSGGRSTVWDPTAEGKNAAKVAAMLDELSEMRAQAERLRRQVADLGDAVRDPGGDAFGRAGAALSGLTRLAQTLADWSARLPATVDPADVPRGGLPERQAAVRDYLMQRSVAVDAALRGVEEERRQAAGQVAAVVDASNTAPGSKAAQQATNDLHAIVAAEQAKLEALRAMRHRLATDAEAARQAGRAAVAADLARDRSEVQALIAGR